MKKFVVGVFVGAMLMMSTQAFGASINYIGKKVSGETPVKVNGETAGNAIIVDNKSFIPVRDISDKIGADISFEKGGVISLTTSSQTPEESTVNTEAIKKQQELIDETKKKIDATAEKVSHYEALVKSATNDIYKQNYQNNYDAFKKSLDQLNSVLKEQEDQLDLLEGQAK
ncbi:hypothetical protein NYE70_23605 [Paenibacillus sp. FSL R5-0407]|uniref:hypothetical protein n=1 Tax=Paenibacillus sp. FSL R5-0407 TaxID=2975320 RepID=UPI0030FB0C79